jgi:hypothetical protein
MAQLLVMVNLSLKYVGSVVLIHQSNTPQFITPLFLSCSCSCCVVVQVIAGVSYVSSSRAAVLSSPGTVRLETSDSPNLGNFDVLNIGSTYDSQYSSDTININGYYGSLVKSTGNINFQAGGPFTLKGDNVTLSASSLMRIKSTANNVQIQTPAATLTANRLVLDSETTVQV